ncbi:MAG: hypothetical protein JW795_21225 [Chitinivibrionales bacterium]|nr:hypothetical protein [Chitinivibrionales bacterium]
MDTRQLSGIGVSSQSKTYTNAVSKNSKNLEKVLEKIATAQRINRASDDAAGLSISEQLRSQSRGFQMASQNVSDALSGLQIADGAVTEMSDMVQRQKELAIQASSDTVTDDQRGQLNKEFQQLSQEIDKISQSTRYNRQNLLNSTELADGTRQVQAGPNRGDSMTLPAFDLSASTLGISKLSISDAASAKAALSGLDDAMNSMNSQRSMIGGVMNRFESTQNNLSVANINTQAAESVIRDQDMAEGLAKMVRDTLLNETSQASLKRFSEITLNRALGLLQ